MGPTVYRPFSRSFERLSIKTVINLSIICRKSYDQRVISTRPLLQRHSLKFQEYLKIQNKYYVLKCERYTPQN